MKNVLHLMKPHGDNLHGGKMPLIDTYIYRERERDVAW